MASKYCQKKERLWREARRRYQNLSEEEKTNGEKRSEKDMEILLRKKKKKSVLRISLSNKKRN